MHHFAVSNDFLKSESSFQFMFEPLDILEGILMTVRQLEAGKAKVENQYPRVVKREGNLMAQDLVSKVFEVSDRK